MSLNQKSINQATRYGPSIYPTLRCNSVWLQYLSNIWKQLGMAPVFIQHLKATRYGSSIYPTFGSCSAENQIYTFINFDASSTITAVYSSNIESFSMHNLVTARFSIVKPKSLGIAPSHINVINNYSSAAYASLSCINKNYNRTSPITFATIFTLLELAHIIFLI
ncbi:hypothetical protein BB561_000299 [Smittium simulii]|uniref:Uncharacterized protein n=1 Tax=Smittium simulii TaxID=133385 RepID=A0A2T9YZV3_9FUNG|nr:hypothetical protein BB561_000299 [Smittium simulii]